MKKIIGYSLLTLVLGFSSCDGFLTKEPVTNLDTEVVLDTYEKLSKATLGAYSALNDGTWYGANFVLSCELRAGNAKNPTNTDFTSGRYINEYSWVYNASSTSGLWNYAYYTIASVNNVINNVDGKETTDVSTQDLNDLKAEALFLRALSYFDLLRIYAQPYTFAPQSLGVPLVYVVDKDALPARNTVAECFDQVVEDLLKAESLMAEDYTRYDVNDPYSVASVPAIQALLSRVYLYMGEWQKCADYATKVIDSGLFNMYTASELPSVWGKDAYDGSEVIFEVFASEKNEYNEYWEDISWMTRPDGYADVVSTADLRDLYEEGDVRGTLFQSHKNAPDHFWTTKYSAKDPTMRPSFADIVVLRLSEMYLNRAEALVHGAQIAGATAENDLLTITSNRGASPVAATLENILLERRKELAFEGHIIYDMARTGTAVHRVDYQGAATAKDIEFPDYRWALPIPKREMDANKNMVQNDGY